METVDRKCRCGEVVVKSMSCGDAKIRAKVVIIKGNDAYAVCKNCSLEVRLPYKLNQDSNAASPPLYIKK